MHFDPVRVVVVNDLGHRVILVIDAHDFAGPRDIVDEQCLTFPLLVSLVPVFVETQHHGAGGFFRSRGGFGAHTGNFRQKAEFCNAEKPAISAGNDDGR